MCQKCNVKRGPWYCTHIIDEIPPEKLEEGDLIEIKRNIYNHWAVYVGCNEVVHLTVDNPQTAVGFSLMVSHVDGVNTGKIKIEPLTYVCSRTLFRVNNKAPSPEAEANKRTNAETVKYALEMTETKKDTNYQLLKGNCEHFAKECRFGSEYAESLQVT